MPDVIHNRINRDNCSENNSLMRVSDYNMRGAGA
jgi:hypothetical protein